MRSKTVIAVVGIAAVVCVAAGLGWVVVRDEPAGTEATDSALPVAAGDPDTPPGEGGDPQGGGTAETSKSGARKPEPRPAAAPADGALWVPIPGAPEALVAVDWDAMGAQLGALVPLLAEVANQASHDEFVADDVARQVAQMRRKIDDVAAPLDQVLPSVFPTDVLSHPAFAANAIAATLHARGMGLSTEQLAGLGERANAANTAEAAAVARELDTDWRLLRAIAGYERRVQYFADFEELLTERQKRGLHADVARDRVQLDPFSATVVWDSVAEVSMAVDTESVAVAAAERLLSTMGLDEKRYRMGHEFVAARIADLPPEWMGERGYWIDAFGFVRGDEVVKWTRWSVEVLVDVLAEVSGGRLPAVAPDVLDAPAIVVWDPAR